MLTVAPDPAAGDGRPADGSSSLIDEIVREGARRMLAEALQAEVDAHIAQFAGERDENGHRLVVRNGSHQPREVLTSAGAVEVTVPRVNDKRINAATGERERFSSAILPPWARKTPKITEVLPLLYLHGLSSGDFVPALGQFLGSASGLSAAVITRLTESWKAGQRAFAERDLSGVDYVYLWADGIHVNIRLEEHKLCLLVMIGVRADGRKELVALADGYRESAESWADLLRDCARRGMRAPVLAVGDGALGFWNGLREVFPELLERTLADCERVFGVGHPYTLRTRNNLATTYCDAGRVAEAVRLHEEILADRERVLGANHPDTLHSRNNLAGAYHSAGQLAEALPLLERTLADSEQTLGGDHPDTLASRNNLAIAYESAGRFGEAIPLYERSLADQERVLGTDHPDTLASRNNLAGAYQSAGRLHEAIPLYRRTLADCERVLGADHPGTRTVRESLAAAQRHGTRRARRWFRGV